MVNWDIHKEKLIKLSNQGLSSTKIADIMSKLYNEIEPTHDRSIRNALQRFRENGDYEKGGKEPAKVLLFDIETAPLISYIWNRFQKYLPDEMLIKEWYVICWSAKWLFEDEMMNGCVTPEESKNRDDKRIVSDLWELLNEADIVIAHNGDKFDVKKINGRFAKYGLNLPMPYKTIDTFKAARKRLSLPSLGLNYIAGYLGLQQKDDTDFKLWVDSMEGNHEALNRMQTYCDQDIRVLEDVYLKLRPFIQPHPNLGMYIKADSKVCPSCASTNLKKEGQYATTVNLYDAFRCQDCGSITRSRNTSITQEDKKTVTSSTPR